MSTLLNVCLIPTKDNRQTAAPLPKSATEHSSTLPQSTTCLLHLSYRGELLSNLKCVRRIPKSHNRPSTYQLQRSATKHNFTCKNQSHIPQQDL
jgi:hypothetical protein